MNINYLNILFIKLKVMASICSHYFIGYAGLPRRTTGISGPWASICTILFPKNTFPNLSNRNQSWFIPVSPTFRNSYSCYSHYVKFRTTYLYSIVCFRLILLLLSKSINLVINSFNYLIMKLSSDLIYESLFIKHNYPN